jgi:hypothetical protein
VVTYAVPLPRSAEAFKPASPACQLRRVFIEFKFAGLFYRSNALRSGARLKSDGSILIFDLGANGGMTPVLVLAGFRRQSPIHLKPH